MAITGCECLVARTGTIVMSAARTSGRTTSVYAPFIFALRYTNQLVYDVKDALQLMKEKYKDNLPSLITFATGPSRTADIEKTLVWVYMDPRKCIVFSLKDMIRLCFVFHAAIAGPSKSCDLFVVWFIAKRVSAVLLMSISVDYFNFSGDAKVKGKLFDYG